MPLLERLSCTARGSKSRLRSSSTRTALSVIFIRVASSPEGISRTAAGASSRSRETTLLPALACSSERKRYADFSLAANEARPPVVERLREVLDGYLRLPGEVGDRPRHPQDAVVSPSGEHHTVYRPREEGLRIASQRTHRAQSTPGERGVRSALALDLRLPRPPDPLPHSLRWLGRLPAAQLVAGEARDADEQIYPVQQGTG